MSKKRKSFIIHHDSLNVLDDLTNEQAGLLFKAIKAYHVSEEMELDVLTNIAMSPFRNQFDRDAEKYEKLCEKNRLIAENRYSTKSTSGKSRNQSLPSSTKSTDNDSKSDSKNKSDSKKEVTSNLSVITDGFNHWWDLYPSARRKNKGGCFNKFKAKCKKLTAEQIEDLVNTISVDIEKRAAEVEDLKYMPMTEPYLNQERWNDGQ